MLLNSPATRILPLRLDHDRMDSTVRVGVESRVERAVRIQASDLVARHAQNTGKEASDENLAVWLHRDGRNHTANSA